MTNELVSGPPTLRFGADRLPERDVRSHSLGNERRPGRAACRLLAKTAKAFDMPIVLSTSGWVRLQRADPPSSWPSSTDQPIDRTSMNAFEDQPSARRWRQPGASG